MKQVDIMKLASNLWKSEPYVVQQKYHREYELLRNAYREKIKVINPSHPDPGQREKINLNFYFTRTF